MSDADDLSHQERQEARGVALGLQSKHWLNGSDPHDLQRRTADAIVESLAMGNITVDARDEEIIRTLIGGALRINGEMQREAERERILKGLGDIGARLNAGELSVIGRPRSGWWFGS